MDTLRAIGTKRVCKTGTGLTIYLDKTWGFQCDDIVNVSVELVRRPGHGDEGKGAEETGAGSEGTD